MTGQQPPPKQNEALDSPAGAREFFKVSAQATGIVLLGYFGLNPLHASWESAGRGGACPAVPLDDLIPFVPEALLLYLLLYPALASVYVLTRRSRRALYECFYAYVFCAALSFVIYVLWPTQMAQPPPECQGALCDLLTQIRFVDGDWNIFPSLHVAYPVCVAVFFFRYGSPGRWLILLACSGIAVSTVLLKRHVVADIPAGVALGLLSAYVGIVWTVRRERALSAAEGKRAQDK